MKHKTNFSQKKTVFRTSWFLIAGSLIVSLLVIAGLLQINQKRNEEVFQKLISEILSVSHQQQELEAVSYTHLDVYKRQHEYRSTDPLDSARRIRLQNHRSSLPFSSNPRSPRCRGV